MLARPYWNLRQKEKSVLPIQTDSFVTFFLWKLCLELSLWLKALTQKWSWFCCTVFPSLSFTLCFHILFFDYSFLSSLSFPQVSFLLLLHISSDLSTLPQILQGKRSKSSFIYSSWVVSYKSILTQRLKSLSLMVVYVLLAWSQNGDLFNNSHDSLG